MDTETERLEKGPRFKTRSITIGPNGTPRRGGSSIRKLMGLRSKEFEKKNNFKKKEFKTMIHDKQDPEEPGHGKENVTITINDTRFEFHRGHHSIAELKMLASVPLAYDLNIVIDGKFEPLPDEGGFTIKGGEIFISNPKDGASS